MYADLKQKLTHNLDEQEQQAKGTNGTAVISTPKTEEAKPPTSNLQPPEKSQGPTSKP